MLKRIAIVAFFTGSGQLLSIFVLKYISQHSTAAQLKGIAQIDSLVFFILNVIALGLQSAAMRNLAQNNNWKQEYHDTQSARISFALLLMGVAAVAFVNPYYIVFLAAPAMAWSGDYALYARGYPVQGSMVAFVRLAIPFSIVWLSAVYFPEALAWVYLASLIVVYLATNAYIAFFLRTPYFFKPSFKSLGLYINSLPLGVVAVSLYFLGLGLILIVPYFYRTEVVAVAFLGLKFYVIFKGVLRIIHQAFIQEMMRPEVSFKVDQLCCLIGLTFASFAICFPGTFIRLFFGEKYLADKWYFILLAIAALLHSLFSSLPTRAMLMKKDRHYSINALLAALLTIVLCMVFSTVWPNAFGIGVGLLIGEIAFAAGMLRVMKEPNILPERSLFLVKNLLIALIPLAMVYIFGDSYEVFAIGCILFGIIGMSVYYKRFKHL